jgi:hypothetical protein
MLGLWGNARTFEEISVRESGKVSCEGVAVGEETLTGNVNENIEK